MFYGDQTQFPVASTNCQVATRIPDPRTSAANLTFLGLRFRRRQAIENLELAGLNLLPQFCRQKCPSIFVLPDPSVTVAAF
jgi:hypothetical protein